MEATITREIILDLVPVYLGGEASESTRTLVETYAAHDPYVKRLLEAGDLTEKSFSPDIQPPDLEMETLKHTRNRVQRQTLFMALGIAGTILALSMGWGGTFLAVGFWIVYFLRREQMNDLLFK